MTKILSWTQPSGRVYQLLGSTFSSKMKGSSGSTSWPFIEQRHCARGGYRRPAQGQVVLQDDDGQGGRQAPGSGVQVLPQGRVPGHAQAAAAQATHRAEPGGRLLLHWGHGYEFEISSSLASVPEAPTCRRSGAPERDFDKLPGNSSSFCTACRHRGDVDSSAPWSSTPTSPAATCFVLASTVSTCARKQPSRPRAVLHCPGCPLSWGCELIAGTMEHIVRYSDANDDFLLDQEELDGVQKSDWLQVLFAVTDPVG